MGDAVRTMKPRRMIGRKASPDSRVQEQTGWLLALIAPLARPRAAGLVALVAYLIGAAAASPLLRHSDFAYFNYLADAFLHGQLHLRLSTIQDVDLVLYADKVYLYWPPLPAILAMPLVALFGVAASDVAYTAILAAVSVGLVAKLLGALDVAGVVPLTAERRAILVATCAFGSVLPILALHGRVWVTSQIVGWVCVLLAAIAAITQRNARGYVLVGLALSGAIATRAGLVFVGVWLAYYLLARDWRQPLRRRVVAASSGLAPLLVTCMLLGWYNYARFGNPLEMGLAWHNYSRPVFGEDFARYGVFSIRYLPTNLYHHFVVYPFVFSQTGVGSGLFWMTPVLLGGPYALWRFRRTPLVWSLALSCLLVYVPIGLVMGTGYLFGSRYLLDLLVPLIVLTALGIRQWRLDVLQLLMLVGWATFAVGASLLIIATRYR